MGGVRPGRFGTSQFVALSPPIQPDRVFVKLARSLLTTFATGAAGAYGEFTLKCNSAADPLGSLSSGVPIGATHWLGTSPSQYGAYIVHAFQVKLEMTSGTANDFPVVVAVSFRPASMAAPTSIAQQQNQSYAAHKFVSPGGTNPTVITRYCTTGQVYGQSPQTVAIADSFSALYNADPSSEVLADVGIQNPDATNAATVYLNVTVTQWVECFGRVTSV